RIDHGADERDTRSADVDVRLHRKRMVRVAQEEHATELAGALELFARERSFGSPCERILRRRACTTCDRLGTAIRAFLEALLAARTAVGENFVARLAHFACHQLVERDRLAEHFDLPADVDALLLVEI